MAVETIVMSRLHLQFLEMRFASAAQRGGRLDGSVKMLKHAAGRFQDSLKSIALAAKASEALNRSNSAAPAADAVAERCSLGKGANRQSAS